MHALFVYAHPEPTSFTAALKDTGAAALREAAHLSLAADSPPGLSEDSPIEPDW